MCSFTSVDWWFADCLPVIDIVFETYRCVSNTSTQMGSEICEAIIYSSPTPAQAAWWKRFPRRPQAKQKVGKCADG